jgi:hypothetical protein
MYHTQENISRGIKIRLWITPYSAIQSDSAAIVSRQQLFFDATDVGVKNGGIGDAGFAEFVPGSDFV